ncbi:hypothetical protein Trisim1_007285 [Trichoderma cf. simile WF8]
MSSNQRPSVKPFLSGKLLVTGAGGKLGIKVIEELLNQGATSIIATTRNPSKLTDLVTRGVEVREADFDKFETLGPVFKGANRLLLISTDALNNPRQRLRQHRAAIKAAIDSGVGRIINSSIPNSHSTSEPSVPDDHFWTEVALFESLLNWTILRNHLNSEVMLLFAERAIQSGRSIATAGTVGRSYVYPDDCVRTALEPWSMHSDITGLNLSRNLVTPEELEQDWLDSGMPPSVAQTSNYFNKDAAQGYQAIVLLPLKIFRAPNRSHYLTIFKVTLLRS